MGVWLLCLDFFATFVYCLVKLKVDQLLKNTSLAPNIFFLVSAQTYCVGGDNLRSLTEKLRSLAHTLQMSIQGRWRVNTNDGQSTNNLSQQVLQAVVDVVTASNALVSLLNRWESHNLTHRAMFTCVCWYTSSTVVLWRFILSQS